MLESPQPDLDFDVKSWHMQFLSRYHINKTIWWRASLKVQKGQTKVNIEHEIMMWESYNTMHVVSSLTMDLELIQKFKQVKQRSMSK